MRILKRCHFTTDTNSHLHVIDKEHIMYHAWLTYYYLATFTTIILFRSIYITYDAILLIEISVNTGEKEVESLASICFTIKLKSSTLVSKLKQFSPDLL